MKKKILWLAATAAVTLMSLPANAQIAKAKTAMTSMTSELTGLFDTVSKVIYAIAALIGLIGGVVVYQKWSSGDPNTVKLVAAWFGSALFLAIVATFLKAMFT
jgi:hypothetical protein